MSKAIEIDFTLCVAGRQASQAGSNGEDPWEASFDLAAVPAHDSWVWIPGFGGAQPQVRSRAGHAVHLYLYPQRSVGVPLYLETLSESEARAIGVEWHPWMNETLAPKPVDEKKAKQDDATRDEFEQWRQIRAEKVADDE